MMIIKFLHCLVTFFSVANTDQLLTVDDTFYSLI